MLFPHAAGHESCACSDSSLIVTVAYTYCFGSRHDGNIGQYADGCREGFRQQRNCTNDWECADKGSAGSGHQCQY